MRKGEFWPVYRMVDTMNLLTKADDSETQKDPMSFTPSFFLLLLLFFEKSKWGKYSLKRDIFHSSLN